MALLVLFFSPEHLRKPTTFAKLTNMLLVSPVLQVLVFSKVIMFYAVCYRIFRLNIWRLPV